ncbi:MAG: alkaline phosphatase family protein [Candidatus Omnitrophica bacterium]|nr:alkaline phosphatase family protein [Candidatus Omnitrophota bacterium]
MFFAYIDPGTGFTLFSFGGWLIAILLALLGFFLPFFKKIFSFLKRPKILIILACVAIVLVVIMTGANMAKKISAFDKKIILIGFDGLSPEIAEPLMEEGRLPNLARLKEEGSYSRLATSNPPQSPVAWSAIATGKNPGENGIFDFIVRDPKTYGLTLSVSNITKNKPKRVLKGEAFWQYLSKSGVPSVIISYPLTFPPDRLDGRMFSGMGVPDILGTEGTFTFYTTEPLPRDKDIGGNVFQVQRSPLMVLNLIGPKVAGAFGKADNVKVPFKVTLKDDNESIAIEFQDNKFEMKPGQWSGWKGVVFNIGLFKKMRGIFKFYLVETEPGFKLYISPINLDPRQPFFAISYPKSYSAWLAKKIGLYHTQGMPFDTWSVNEKRLTEAPFLEHANDVFGERKAMLNTELDRFDKGLLFCYFEITDIIQHMFWRYTDPDHPLYRENAPMEYKNEIKDLYERMDAVTGEVMKRLGPGDTLMIMSDHGFNTFRTAVHVNTWLRDNGYLELKDPYAPSGAELLSDIDWSKTKAYAIGFGAIYVNQKGRERDGIVEPGAETEALKKEISARLKEWTDEKYGAPVINNVYAREEIFRGDYAGKAPDLYIGFNIGYRASWQTALGGVPEGLLEDNLKEWSGDHLFDPALVPGVIFSNRKIVKKDPSVYDITPTVLKAAGYTDEKVGSCGFDGGPLF